MASIESFGIITAENLLNIIPEKEFKKISIPIVTAEISQTIMPNWWSKTLGKMIKVNKIAEKEKINFAKLVSTNNFNIYVKEKNWPEVIKLLDKQPYSDNKDYKLLKEKINAFIIQHQILQELILEAIEQRPKL